MYTDGRRWKGPSQLELRVPEEVVFDLTLPCFSRSGLWPWVSCTSRSVVLCWHSREGIVAYEALAECYLGELQ